MSTPNIAWFPMFVAQFPEAERFRDDIESLWDMAVDDAERALELEKENDALRGQVKRLSSVELQMDRQREHYRAVLTDHYDKATSYYNVVFTVGYAGIFTTWSLTAPAMNRLQNAWVAGLALLSLFFFVGWEIAKAVQGSMTARRLAKLSESDSLAFEANAKELHRAENRDDELFAKGWVFALVGSLVPGLACALLLGYLTWARVAGLG
jgi:hypothetical protein